MFCGLASQASKFCCRKVKWKLVFPPFSIMDGTLSSKSGMKRLSSETNTDGAEDVKRIKVENQDENSMTVGPLLKQKMVALLLSYSGQGYLGMQRNPGCKTIEEDLLKALLEAGAINEKQFDVPQMVRFQRAARTDKGVSAVRQIVSLKLALQDNLIDKINEALPPQIRVFGIKRVTRGFDSKITCDARTYSYMLPTFAFASVDEATVESYRAPASITEDVNNILHLFKGTHNFHNFTAGRKAADASCKRYIMEFECSEPFVREGLEFVVITVKGQSFMLHHIRKMMGLTIAIIRGHATKETIEKAWGPERIDIPIAPGLGLILEEVHYEYYNKRYGGDGMHESLKWDEYQDQIMKFKEDFIYPTIIEGEKQEKTMFSWLPTLLYHTFDVRENQTPICKAAKLIRSADKEIKSDIESNGTVGIPEKEENQTETQQSTTSDINTEESLGNAQIPEVAKNVN